MKPLLRNKTAGFTLLEIMLVIIIIVTLMAVLLPNLKNAMSDSKKGEAQIYITTIAGNLAQYELLNGMPPSSSQGLKALMEKPAGDPHPRKWRQHMEKILPDPWGVDYRYEFPGRHNKNNYDVFSCGPDRAPNTEDDIGNWD